MKPLCMVMAALLVGHGVPAVAGAAPEPEKLAIAVVDFTNTSGDESFDYLSKTIPENLITALAEGGELKIVERERLESALKEMKLQVSDIMDEATAIELGKAVGAGAIIVGSFVTIENKIRISSRLIDVQTATVITGKKETGRVGEDIFRVMDEMADAMREELLARVESQEEIETLRVPVTKPPVEKRGGGKTLLYVLGGAAVVGAGVGVAMALSDGKDEDDGDNDATVTIRVTW